MAHRLIRDGALVLYGPVGFPAWFEEDEGFTASEVLAALTEFDGDVTVRLNSGGGFAFDGVAIHNALAAHAGRIRIEIDAVAASAASVIAMAGDQIVMRAGALMMIHDASGLTIGTSEDHEKTIGVLSRLDHQMAGIYARRTGMDREEVAALMDAETWMTGTEALERGFATATEDADPAPAAAFAWQLYGHAPPRLRAETGRWFDLDALRERIAASLSDLQPHPAASPRRQKEEPMPPKDVNANGGPEGAAAEDWQARAEALEVEIAALKAQTAEEARTATAQAHAEIAALCNNAGVPAMAPALIREGLAPKDAAKRIEGAKDIRAAVEAARRSCPAIEASLADAFIAAGTRLETVRAELFERIAAAEATGEISPVRPGNGAPAKPDAVPADAWDKAVAKVNARFDARAARAG